MKKLYDLQDELNKIQQEQEQEANELHPPGPGAADISENCKAFVQLQPKYFNRYIEVVSDIIDIVTDLKPKELIETLKTMQSYDQKSFGIFAHNSKLINFPVREIMKKG